MPMKEITVAADCDNLDKVTAMLEEYLDNAGAPVSAAMKISVALEEMFVNVAHYAYTDTDVPEEDRTVTVRFEDVQVNGSAGIKITLSDHGKPYDPLAKEDPDTTLSADVRPIGGLGIFMVKKSMDNVSYDNIDGFNTFSMEKAF